MNKLKSSKSTVKFEEFTRKQHCNLKKKSNFMVNFLKFYLIKKLDIIFKKKFIEFEDFCDSNQYQPFSENKFKLLKRN